MRFPTLMHNEHIYSMFVRNRYLSGLMYISDRRFYEIMDIKYHWIRSQVPLCSNLQSVIQRFAPDRAKHFALRIAHTPLAPWLFSIPENASYETLKSSGNRNNLEENPYSIDKRWKFCPICASNELEENGFSYWHSSHQSLGALMCDTHGTPLHSHETLRYLDFTLPQHWLENSSPLSCNEPWQLDWQPFIYNLNSHIQSNHEWPKTVKQSIQKELGIDGKVKFRDKPIFDKQFEQMKEDLGNSCLEGLFTCYSNGNKRPTNLLWVTPCGMGSAGKLRHPLYWLAVMFWLREEISELRALA